ncbi:maleylpyruvate isomerase family mycothiol-dependent enzyme [Skermania sp. ID1734]|uniref:maleylpyruvate isomerase family mycothiol-dependent enzyme n=1 Tax=Skermania sp. ID1734 TaxID=2597516 RepID=UPI00117F4538|nr:maleylpyruvate isomerase family mycothiol-dependent enzyme [Skermania sp. ID1734]TSD93941.1 maleylpyruvate isomerase family mycothiol-dependent enzyme [Skermania sp. ID1734]
MSDKQAIVSGLIDEWRVLEELLEPLDEEQWLTPSALPGWTVHDVVAHIIGTELMLLGEQPPHTGLDPHTLAHVRNEIGAFNEQWVESMRRDSASTMLARFKEVTGKRAQALAAATDEEWNAPAMGPLGMTTYGGFMHIRLFDCWMHELDIRDAVDQPRTEATDRDRLGMQQLCASLGYAVGKLGKAPAGSRVAFELTGALPQRIYVAVDGRATVVDALDGPETIGIRLDSWLFVRLCGGRTKADRHLDEVELSGDVKAAKHIAEHLAFTI